jgi:long-chain acyl-CoA synthetase
MNPHDTVGAAPRAPSDPMNTRPTILDYVFEHEQQRPGDILLTQPLGAGRVADYSWRDAIGQARCMAAHLKTLGLPPGARIAILSKNCAHFVMAELAIWMAGCTTVAIFPTETAKTVGYVLEHSEASLLFVGKLDLWPQQQPGVTPGLRCIALPLSPATGFDSWDAIVERTEPLPGRIERAPEDLAMLIYTSGSTGTPKGVMLEFRAVTAASEGIVEFLRSYLGDGPQRVLSYLPLAHSYERAWIQCAQLVRGQTQIFFAETLQTFLADLQRARPTMFASVPRLWLKFQLGVFSKMPPKKLDRLLGLPLIGRLVGRKVLKGLGLDHVKLAGSGSAPIPAELIEWYHRIGLNLIEGYGMSEDFAYSHTSTPQLRAPGYVGVPMPGVQVRIAPDGEVLIKSPGRLRGYFKRPDLDAESFTEDGFFHTGDRGERRADGLLRITGRAKELFKTTKGEYVAPAPIESMLEADPWIEASMVSGANHPFPYALVVLAEDLRPRMGDAAFRAEVEAEMGRLLDSVGAKLPDAQRPRMIVVLNEPWTIENGCLTPTMKVRRYQIEANVAAQVDAWYAAGQRVQWA